MSVLALIPYQVGPFWSLACRLTSASAPAAWPHELLLWLPWSKPRQIVTECAGANSPRPAPLR